MESCRYPQKYFGPFVLTSGYGLQGLNGLGLTGLGVWGSGFRGLGV